MHTAAGHIKTLIIRLSFILLSVCLFAGSQNAIAAPVVVTTINGVSGDQLTNVELLLSIVQQSDHPLLTLGRIKRLHEKADEEIRTALQTYGYYRIDIEKSLEQTGEERWHAKYFITLNEPIRLENVNIKLTGDGASNPKLIEIIKQFPLSEGDALNHELYEKTKSAIIQLTTEMGFFEKRFIEQRIDIDLEKYSARITLIIDSGPRYHFGEITLEQDVLNEDYLQRFISFSQGDPYSVAKLIDLQHALSNSDYFHEIKIEPDTSIRDSREVPVSVILTPRKRHKYTFGLGYGTDTRIRGKIGWAVPRVNRRGHRFDSEIKASSVSSSISANYHIPIGDPRKERVTFSAAVADKTTTTSDSVINSVGVSLVQVPGKWRRIISLNYQDEDYQVASDSGISSLLIPGINWTRIWADNVTNVRKGFRLDLGVRGASEKILSDSSFAQANLGAKLVRSISAKNRIHLRGNAGSTLTNQFHQLPASIRYFTGGSQSIRGFSYQSLGPTNALGQVEGGTRLLVGSAELEHHLTPKWSVAVFVDHGNAINTLNDPMETGAGFGARWQTPIGPIRVDLASALSREGNPWRVHINIGPDL